MYTIENEVLKVSVNTRGAELESISSKATKLEYLWSGDTKYWNKKSPILFPIVGALRENTYYYNGQAYHLPRHGFAREREFSCTNHLQHEVSFSLGADDETMKVYPFPFLLVITYQIESDQLSVSYKVLNTGDSDLFFSIGGHPAFRIPLEPRMDYDDYYLEFEKNEHAMRWLISPHGLIEPTPVHYLREENKLPLTKQLFMKDAIVFKHLNSDVINIKCDKSPHGIEFRFPRFPYLGIWAAPNADFVCLEPWCGIADSTHHDQQLLHKEGINMLVAGQWFERTWTARFY